MFIIYILTRPVKSRIIRTSHIEIINNIPDNNNQFLEGRNNSSNNKEIIPTIDFQSIPGTKSILRPIYNNQEPDFIINNEVNSDIELLITDKKVKNQKPKKITDI